MADERPSFEVKSRLLIERVQGETREVFIEASLRQPDAPVTTALAHEAAALQSQCRLLALGAEVSANGLEEPHRSWCLALAQLCRAVELVPKGMDPWPESTKKVQGTE